MKKITIHKILAYFSFFLGIAISLMTTWYVCKKYIYEKQYSLRFDKKELTTATISDVELSYKYEDSVNNVEEEYYINYHYYVNDIKYNSYGIHTKRGQTYEGEKIKIGYVTKNPKLSYVKGNIIDDDFIFLFFSIYFILGWTIAGLWYFIIVEKYFKWIDDVYWQYY